ncbi:MAG: long-chain fatty acid--CoA ligase [Thermoplasmata archaeon]|jgi:long-chain acyl-CoA synthetase|nr:long-chain fatty acid--CoA ligase [Thermoplasmata archaeon]
MVESGAPAGPVWLSRYPASVPPTLEIPAQLLPEVIEQAVHRWPDRTALVYYGAKWSYRRLWRESGAFASALARDGIRAGDRVAIYLPNCPAYPIALLGILRLGAIVVQVSPLYIGQDLSRMLLDSTPKAVVTLEILYPNLAKVRAEAPVPILYVARLRELYPLHARPFVNLVLRRRGLPTAFPRGDPSVRPWTWTVHYRGTIPEFHGDPATSVAVLQYTGGTTGIPKAAMLTHRNLHANLLQINSWNTRRKSGEEVLLASIPFFHIYALTVALFAGLADGATIVIQTRPDIPELLKLIDRYAPTQFPGVPALYAAFNNTPGIEDHPKIRAITFCVSGSAPLPLEVARRFQELTGGTLIEGYGLSETSPVTHVNPTEGEQKVGSIGIPVPNTDQRIVDPETGTRVLPVGEVGELDVRGPQVMLGYYHNEGETRAVLRDGWFRTGDLARLDADGFAFIVDRKKDTINVGGMKVYPREVEEVLFQHPAVADAAAIGVPDPIRGEAVKAFVVPKPGTHPTEEELIGFVRERIAHYKAPRTVEFRTSLPKTGVQKVLRRVLKEESLAASAASPDPAPTSPAR